MSEWKPIETAPKEGDYLVYQPPTNSGRLHLPGRICLRWDAGFVRETTHWMPISQPPNEGQAVSKWRDISTAPKDGTWVLVRGGEIFYGWDALSTPAAVVAQFAPKSELMDGRWQFAYYDRGFYGEYENPTEWMPIPE